MRLMDVRRSHRPSKKLVATFRDEVGRTRAVHFGARGFGDFTTYSRRDPALARRKRMQYVARHGTTEDWTNPLAPGTLSRFVLWEKPTLEAAIRSYRKRFRV